VHPVERSGALQQPTCALVANAKRCHILSTAAHSPSWRRAAVITLSWRRCYQMAEDIRLVNALDNNNHLPDIYENLKAPQDPEHAPLGVIHHTNELVLIITNLHTTSEVPSFTCSKIGWGLKFVNAVCKFVKKPRPFGGGLLRTGRTCHDALQTFPGQSVSRTDVSWTRRFPDKSFPGQDISRTRPFPDNHFPGQTFPGQVILRNFHVHGVCKYQLYRPSDTTCRYTERLLMCVVYLQ